MRKSYSTTKKRADGVYVTEKENIKKTKRLSTEEKLRKRMIELHPRFLEAVKDAYPLAVLGSLCVAIAAFTKDTFPSAQGYAITASSLFLVGFISSLVFQFHRIEHTAFFSYASTGLGIVFLFLVIIEFAQSIPYVWRSILVIPSLFIMSILISLILTLTRFVKSSKSRLVHIFGFIGIVSTTSWLLTFFAPQFLELLSPNFESPTFLKSLSNISFLISLVSVATTLLFLSKTSPKKTS